MLRELANERVISRAVADMITAQDAVDSTPQRTLLRDVAHVLFQQERAAARIELSIRESVLQGRPIPAQDRPVVEDLLSPLLGLPEPQSLITGFLEAYCGGPESGTAFTALAGQIVTTATAGVFADLGGGDAGEPGAVKLDKLLALAADGNIAPVALAALDMAGRPVAADTPVGSDPPGLTDAEPGSLERVVEALDQATRRQLRLATLLHAKAGEILQTRERERTRTLSRPKRRQWSLRFRLRRWLTMPLRRRDPGISSDDLSRLEIVFDAIGESVAAAGDCVRAGQPARAAYLLSGVRVPAPAGIPGRIYNQDSLAQARPLAVLGAWHRLALCRWADETLRAGPVTNGLGTGRRTVVSETTAMDGDE